MECSDRSEATRVGLEAREPTIRKSVARQAAQDSAADDVSWVLASCEAALVLLRSMLVRRDFSARFMIDPLLENCTRGELSAIVHVFGEADANHLSAAVVALEEAIQRTDCFIYSTDPEPQHGRALLAEAEDLLHQAEQEYQEVGARLP